MPDELAGGALADSPTADSSSPAITPTGGEPTPPQTPAEQTVPYSRFQQVIQQKNEALRQAQAAAQAQQGLQQRLQQIEQQTRDAQTPREYQEAGDALLKIIQAHPQLRGLIAAMQSHPQSQQTIQQLNQQVASLSQQSAQAVVGAGRRAISDFSKEAGLPTDQKSLGRIEELVRAELEGMDGGVARFRSGDPTVLKEAFDSVAKDFFAVLRRQANAQLADTKNQTRRLPPRPGGGLPTPAAPPKLEEGKERDYMRTLSELSRQAMTAGQQG